MSYIFHNVFIIIFITYSIFWVNPKHNFINIILNKTKFIFLYLGLWHAWNMFTNPYHENKIIHIKKRHANGEEDSEIFFDPAGNFLNKKKNTYVTKLLENFCSNDNVKNLLGEYITRNTNITNLEFTIEYSQIKDPSSKNAVSSASRKVVYNYKK